jgi:DNA-binding MarR family transcriptional regulator
MGMTPAKPGQSGNEKVMQFACACANVRRASRVITQFYDSVFQAGGQSIAQFGLLHALSMSRIATQAQLGTILSIDPTTLSRTLRPLLRQKLIERIPGTDRREQYLQLTASGRKQLKKTLPHWLRAQARLRKSLGDENWNQMQKLLTRAVEATQKA